MDRIARDAGVGKQTIYRWWPSKASVLLEAVRENCRANAGTDVPAATTLEGRLALFFRTIFTVNRDLPGLDRVLQALMAEAQFDASFRTEFRNNLVEPMRKLLDEVLAAQAEPSAHATNPALLLDLAFGVIWYRRLTGTGALDDALADELAALLTRLVQA